MKIVVGLPAYGGRVATCHAQMWFAFGDKVALHRSVVKSCHFVTVDVCGVDRARNLLLAHAMKLDANWLLMVDSDTWVDDGGLLLRMLIQAERLDEERRIGIVGACVMRGVDGKEFPNVYQFNDQGKHECVPAEEMPAGADPRIHGPFLPVDALGAAVMAINLRRVEEHMHFAFGEISEDLGFCKQMRETGAMIYCDPRIPTHHLKSHVMDWKGV